MISRAITFADQPDERRYFVLYILPELAIAAASVLLGIILMTQKRVRPLGKILIGSTLASACIVIVACLAVSQL